MTSRTAGDCAVDALNTLGVRHRFGIPSVHNLQILDALLRNGRITRIIVCNEACIVDSADGLHARAANSG